jgi:hypothetical protein
MPLAARFMKVFKLDETLMEETHGRIDTLASYRTSNMS